MRITFSTITCPEYSIGEAADAARRFGYDGIELYGHFGQRLTTALLKENLADYKKALKGIDIVSMTCWAHLGSPKHDAERIEADAAEVHAMMDMAADFGSPYVKIFGGELPEHGSRETNLRQMRDALEGFCQHAERLGLGINVETHDTFASARALSELMAIVPRSWPVGVIWDIQHPHRLGEPADEVDSLLGDRVRHVHFKDAVKQGGKWRHVLFGRGELPIVQAVKLLSARAYEGCWSLDWGRMWDNTLEPASVVLPAFGEGLASLERDLQHPRA